MLMSQHQPLRDNAESQVLACLEIQAKLAFESA